MFIIMATYPFKEVRNLICSIFGMLLSTLNELLVLAVLLCQVHRGECHMAAWFLQVQTDRETGGLILPY